jgi:hypothetical protein
MTRSGGETSELGQNQLQTCLQVKSNRESQTNGPELRRSRRFAPNNHHHSVRENGLGDSYPR